MHIQHLPYNKHNFKLNQYFKMKCYQYFKHRIHLQNYFHFHYIIYFHLSYIIILKYIQFSFHKILLLNSQLYFMKKKYSIKLIIMSPLYIPQNLIGNHSYLKFYYFLIKKILKISKNTFHYPFFNFYFLKHYFNLNLSDQINTHIIHLHLNQPNFFVYQNYNSLCQSNFCGKFPLHFILMLYYLKLNYLLIILFQNQKNINLLH